jgi:hypothetical protein
MTRSGREDERLSGLMWGIGLVLVGTVILLQYLDVMPFSVWRDWWPLIIVMVGVAQIVGGRGPKGLGDGVSTMLIGAWCFVATNHVYGLTWRNSWPLALVATGMGMVVRSIAAGFTGRPRDGQEVRNDG